MGDYVFASEGNGDDRLTLHEISHSGKEGSVSDVRVVLLEQFVSKTNHLAAPDAEAFVFKTFDDSTVDAFGNTVGLEQDEGGFLGHVQKVGRRGLAQCRP